jgi:hypothetical protein
MHFLNFFRNFFKVRHGVRGIQVQNEREEVRKKLHRFPHVARFKMSIYKPDKFEIRKNSKNAFLRGRACFKFKNG